MSVNAGIVKTLVSLSRLAYLIPEILRMVDGGHPYHRYVHKAKQRLVK